MPSGQEMDLRSILQLPRLARGPGQASKGNTDETL